MIPLYGFLAGDTIGVLVYARGSDTVAEVARKLERRARLRGSPLGAVRVSCRGRDVPLASTVAESGIRPLDRVEFEGLHEDEASVRAFEDALRHFVWDDALEDDAC